MKSYELVGCKIDFSDNRTVEILEGLGIGASSTGYKCEIAYSDGTHDNVILKEFLPKGFDFKVSRDNYLRALPAQTNEFKVKYNAYIRNLNEIRAVLKAIETTSLKRYYVEPPYLDKKGIDKDGKYESVNHDSFFKFNEKNNIFCGLTLYPFDSSDISNKICCYSIKERIDILSKLCLIIDKFHENNIILADLKPENFLYDKDDIGGFCLKLFDFDSILKIDQNGKLLPNQKPTGTPYFSAPEIRCCSSSIGKKSDVYSIGALLLYFVMKECFDDFINLSKEFTKRELKHIKDIFIEENYNKLVKYNKANLEWLNKDYHPITIGFWNKFKSIVLKAMDANTTRRYGNNEKTPMKSIYEELVVLMGIYENKGVHPEVMLDKAIEVAQNIKIGDIDEDLFTSIKEVNEEN